jgi:hypothetical protein
MTHWLALRQKSDTMPGLSTGRKSAAGEKMIRFLTSLGSNGFIYNYFTVFYSQFFLKSSFLKDKK